MAEHSRSHRVPSGVKVTQRSPDGMGQHTEQILDGIQKINAIAVLVESVIVWRATAIARKLSLGKAEALLFRLIYKEGCENAMAMDMLARIYFQQQRYDKAKDLWERALALQPGNPALRRTVASAQRFAKSPSLSMMRYRFKLFLKAATCCLLLLVVSWGGMRVYGSIQKWMEGPQAVQVYRSYFSYDYDSQIKDFKSFKDLTFVPPSVSDGDAGEFTVTYARRKVSSGADLGRIEVVVEREGDTVRASGKLPNLHLRYLVEQALREIPGVLHVDLQNLEVERSYKVRKGDNLWVIARRIYGSGQAWTVLSQYNDLSNPSKLRIGQDLALPLGDEKIVPVNMQ